MYFLGQASSYKFKDRLRHTFAVGSKKDLSELRAYLAAHYGTTRDRVAVYHTGRSALSVAIQRTVPADSEVVATSLTCYAVVEAIRDAGCTPIFADIDLKTLHFGVKELQKVIKLHPNIKAVIVQNNLGNPCDIVGIEKFCKSKKIAIIEDLAHSTGIKYRDGREAGTVGQVVALSFGKGKSIDTISGGAVVFTDPNSETITQPTKRPHFSDRFRDRFYPFFGHQIRFFYHFGKLGKLFTSLLLKIHFIERSADAELNTKTRITYWQAKLALKQLKSIPRSGRKPIREHFFVKNRDQVLEELEKMGYVFNDTWYDSPVSPTRYYQKVNFPENECPNALLAAKTLINFPTFYPKKALSPARKLIKGYLITDKADIPSVTPKIKPVAKPVEKKAVTPKEPEFDFDYGDKNPVEYDFDELLALASYSRDHVEDEEDDDPEITTYTEEYEEVSEDGQMIIHGTVNYTEVVVDQFDKKHLNRTNIIDNYTNSDGTVSAPTWADTHPPEIAKNNLPKMKQTKRPEPKGPEQTEGKVW